MRAGVIWGLVVLGVAAWAEGFAAYPYTPSTVTAKVPWYTVAADLGNVSNAKVLPKLTAAQRKMLADHRFLAAPTADEQLFYLYENNTYRKIPSFVTTDSVLHSYHIFYDFTLRYLEKERLFPAVKELSRRMLDANLDALQEGHNPEVTIALTRNAAYFAVPLIQLGEQPTLPAGVQALVKVENARIDAHTAWTPCLTGAQVNYTQFIPRGHYTRSEEFKRYFKAMMWYGLVPMNLESKLAFNPRPVLQACIITEQLQQDAQARTLWQLLYDPTVFYVGKADDLSYYQLAPVLTRVFGAGGLDRFDDAAKLKEFTAQAAKELPRAGIQTYDFREGGGQGLQFRFMGQRFIPDSRILQELTWDKVGTKANKRYFPLGLDVFAVLGSPRAAQLLDGLYKQTEYANYLSQRNKLTDEVRALTLADWGQNLYYGWMYCLLPTLTPAPEGYPAFMRGTAWQDKSLLTALGSWTELRHDTILYAKQSSVAECGDSGGSEPPPPIPGYVEPQVEVYRRLTWLLEMNKQGLVERKLSNGKDELAQSFDQFIDLTKFLEKAAVKELTNQPLSNDDLRVLERYGGELEWLMLSMNNMVNNSYSESWWEIENKTDRSMALVADVHTANDTVLEEAVGNAAELWVIVPFKGKLIAARGAVFTYYEFTHPSADRLTDEAWQAKLKKGTAPPMPTWTGSFMIAPLKTPPTTPATMSTGEEGGGC